MVRARPRRALLSRPRQFSTIASSCLTNRARAPRRYADENAPEQGGVRTLVPPSADEEGNELEMEFGLSKFKDHQRLTVQEMPERSPHGQLPRSIDVIADDDLADNCKPGDRVQIVGVYRAIANSAQNTSGFFKTLVIANNVRGIGKQLSSNQLNEDDVMNIRRMSRKPDIFELLARSVAPSIYGHNYIKKALLLPQD